MKLFLKITAAILFFSFVYCKENQESQASHKKEQITIDNKVILSGDISKIISPLWWGVSIYDGKEQYEKDLKKFSKEQRLVFAIEWYFAEVNNGGHDQFYFNSTGIVWEDALNGLIAIDAPAFARILKESAKRFQTKPPFERSARQEIMLDLDLNFDDLDENFYDLGEKENVYQKISNYIKKQRSKFYFSGEVEIPVY